MATVRREWDSLSDFVDYASGPSEMKDSERSSREGSNYRSFTGVSSFTEATDIAFSWAEGAERVKHHAARVSAQGVAKPRRKVVMREVGPGVISMGNYLSGHPQPYVALEESQEVRKGKGKIVRITLNASASAGVGADVLEARGAATLALISALERAGRRTEVYVCAGLAPLSWGSKSTDRLEYVVKIKAANQKFNLRTIAFAVAHPAMLRRLIFSVMEREAAAERKQFAIPGGYGMPAEVKKIEGIYIGEALLGSVQWKKPEKAYEWVKDTAAKQGVTLN